MDCHSECGRGDFSKGHTCYSLKYSLDPPRARRFSTKTSSLAGRGLEFLSPFQSTGPLICVSSPKFGTETVCRRMEDVG